MNRFILPLLLILTLCTSAFGQRPVGANPYTDPPVAVPVPNACGLGKTPDPACLDAALQTFDWDTEASRKVAEKAWDVEKASLDTQYRAIEATYHAAIAACGTDDACKVDVTLTFAADMQAAHDAFVQADNAIYAVFAADIQAARAAYSLATAACCVDINTINPAVQAPKLGACQVVIAEFGYDCPDGLPLDQACVDACRATFHADLAAGCAAFDAAVAAAYVTLINAQIAATDKLVVDGAACMTQECVQAAIDEYNVTFNQIWKDFHEVYMQASKDAYQLQNRLFNQLVQCVSQCCGN